MKPNANTRKTYNGPNRSLVIALDVGTTFSGVSYAILEPGEVPKIHGVTRFPGQEHVAGNSKIPSVMYYDRSGKLKVAGAETESASILSQAEEEGWTKAELFKLRLRPKSMKLQMNGMRLKSLPQGKTAIDVFGDFLSYLYLCTRNFIIDTHANGPALWSAVERDIQFVLSHPNGWEGAQQAKMRRSAVSGGLIPDTNEGRARIRFVSEGEASLHACILNGLAADVLSNPSRPGFLIADAGGGTLDVSSYAIRGIAPLVIEEIAPPDCVFAGSVFVSRRARDFLEEKLKNSSYGSPDALDHITKRFDETTKRLFRDRKDVQYIPFGSPLDKDVTVGIRGGQLKLTGDEVGDFFEPSVMAAVASIKAQIDASEGVVDSVWLVGGFAASPYLFRQLRERLAPLNVTVSRPDSQTSKAVADGAIGFYCDHHVSARMSKYMYGVEYLREFNPHDDEHLARKHRLCDLPSGPRLLPDAFDCILSRGVRVKESTVFTRKYCTELTNLNTLSVFEVDVWCYRGGNSIPKWILRQAEDFSTLCVVRADLSPLSQSARSKQGRNGKTYWTIVFSVEIHFGLTEFRARIKWVDEGRTKYGPASIIYNESGVRAEDDEPGTPREEKSTYVSSRSEKYASKPGSRARSRESSSVPGPGRITRESSNKGTSAYEAPRSSHVTFVNGPNPRSLEYEQASSQAGPSSNPSALYVNGERERRESEKVRAKEQDRGRASEKGKERERSYNPQFGDPIADTLTSVWGTIRSPSYSGTPPIATPNVPYAQSRTPVEAPKEKEKTPARTPSDGPRSADPAPAVPPSWSSANALSSSYLPPSAQSYVPEAPAVSLTRSLANGQSKKKEKAPSPAWGSSTALSGPTSSLANASNTANLLPISREPSGRAKEKEKNTVTPWSTFGTSVPPLSPIFSPSKVVDPLAERAKAPSQTPREKSPTIVGIASAELLTVTPSRSSKLQLPAVERSPPLSLEVSGALNGQGDANKINGDRVRQNGNSWGLNGAMEEASLFSAEPPATNGFSFAMDNFSWENGPSGANAKITESNPSNFAADISANAIHIGNGKRSSNDGVEDSNLMFDDVLAQSLEQGDPWSSGPLSRSSSHPFADKGSSKKLTPKPGSSDALLNSANSGGDPPVDRQSKKKKKKGMDNGSSDIVTQSDPFDPLDSQFPVDNSKSSEQQPDPLSISEPLADFNNDTGKAGKKKKKLSTSQSSSFGNVISHPEDSFTLLSSTMPVDNTVEPPSPLDAVDHLDEALNLPNHLPDTSLELDAGMVDDHVSPADRPSGEEGAIQPPGDAEEPNEKDSFLVTNKKKKKKNKK